MTHEDDTLPETPAHFVAHEMLAVPQGLPEALSYFCDVYKLERDDVLDVGRLVLGALSDAKQAAGLMAHLKKKISPEGLRALRSLARDGAMMFENIDRNLDGLDS